MLINDKEIPVLETWLLENEPVEKLIRSIRNRKETANDRWAVYEVCKELHQLSKVLNLNLVNMETLKSLKIDIEEIREGLEEFKATMRA